MNWGVNRNKAETPGGGTVAQGKRIVSSRSWRGKRRRGVLPKGTQRKVSDCLLLVKGGVGEEMRWWMRRDV